MNSIDKRHPNRRQSFRWIFVFVLLAYIGSYIWLSRVGMAEAEKYGIEGFLYVPADEVMVSHDLTMHYCLMLFYEPLNAIDRTLFGTTGPTRCILFDIS